MKRACVFFMLVALVAGIAVCGVTEKPKTEYLRIHIRANSNGEEDQTVKYAVKDAVTEFLTPILIDCKDKVSAETAVKESLNGITLTADKVLKENGFDYSSRAGIYNEEFPSRVYKDLTLESGYYDALIIELGSGKGDNWWCVVYPPLCFTGSGNPVYKSKIKEIIDGFYIRRNNEKT